MSTTNFKKRTSALMIPERIYELYDKVVKGFGKPKFEITEEQRDKPIWIDTSTMICDPLTKGGPRNFADRLRRTMQTGWLELTPTNESLLRKVLQQSIRLQKAMGATDDIGEPG